MSTADSHAGDWKIFAGDGQPHDGLASLPAPPPWRFAHEAKPLKVPDNPARTYSEAEDLRAAPFVATDPMKIAVNAALYLRRPLLLTGRPGTGKSTLIACVAHELKLGAVLRWPINSRSTVRSGVYEYDAVGRLQAGRDREPSVESYMKLGPLGTALLAKQWPRALLIDEIDKSDLDFANDLLNVIEEGTFEIPELRRLDRDPVEVLDFEGEPATIHHGRLNCQQFPFVVMTSNAEREFPAPFLRRCIRLHVETPKPKELSDIVRRHLARYADALDTQEVEDLVRQFDASTNANHDVAIDQLLNSIFLTVALKNDRARSFNKDELTSLREQLMQPLTGQRA